MPTVIHSADRALIKMWLPISQIEEGALEQAQNLAKLPFVHKWVALMPDTHQGYGMPIGGVLATKGVVIPNAVGVDIGCGMGAVRTNLKVSDLTPDQLKAILGEARKTIPVGFNSHPKPQDEWFTHFTNNPAMMEIMGMIPVLDAQTNRGARAPLQLGTLGGGNHFIEIQADQDDNIWVMLHSGSRNLGKQVADIYHKKAQELCALWHIPLPDQNLAYLPFDTEEGREYVSAMNFCLMYAQLNRDLMMMQMLWAISTVSPVQELERINIHHNFARLESHYGENVWVHRKGATCVREGTLGIIPGSMGTASYIVVGKGNPESFSSCSHGAGRAMGRKEACRSLNLQEEMEKMSGIVHGIRNTSDLEEAPGAYKNIETVMENQKDLVSIRTTLRPLASLKG